MSSLELKPDRNLLDPNFESYKLSLDSLPIFKGSVPSTLSIKQCSDDQFSYNHARLFSSASVLSLDPFTQTPFLLAADSICHVTGDQQPECVPVWTIPAGVEAATGEYNPTLKFASDEHAVFGDGRGTLFILKTADRQTPGKEWQTSFHDEICGKGQPFVVADAKVSEKDGNLHCLFLYVQDKTSVDNVDAALLKNVNFVNVVEWMIFKEVPDNSGGNNALAWNLQHVRRFVFLGNLEFISLDEWCENIFCVTDKPVKLVFDSNGMDYDDDDYEVPVVAAAAAEVPEQKPAFIWSQGVEDMSVWIMLPEDAHKRDIKVTLKPKEISVTFRGETKVSGALWNILDSDSMTWTIAAGKLEITCCKANEGLVWQRFLAEGPDGEEAMHGDDVADRLAHLTTDDPVPNPDRPGVGAEEAFNVQQELEECDAESDRDLSLLVIASSSNKVSHRCSLEGRQWLFNLEKRGSFCLRHDVDGLVWEPEGVNFKHSGTFQALGYVQASKQQRKATICAPDLSFAAICDHSKHVYVYRQPSAIDTDLRNRKSGERVKRIAKQQVVTLETMDEVLGAVANDKNIYIATKNDLFSVCVNP